MIYTNIAPNALALSLLVPAVMQQYQGQIYPLPNAGGATADLSNTPTATAEKTKELLDVIADPTRSHFFNTDCVSCHTETRRAMELLKVTNIPGIDTAALPNGPWDVRNFG